MDVNGVTKVLHEFALPWHLTWQKAPLKINGGKMKVPFKEAYFQGLC